MGKGAVPTTHPLYIGNCGMHGKYAANMAVMECDLLFSIGTRFNDRITGDLNEFAPHAQIVHIDVDTASISRNVVVDVPVVADAGVALEKLLEWAEKKDTAKWQEQIHRWEKENPLAMRRDRGISPQMIMEHINAQFPHSIYVTDVGQHQMWATQYLELDEQSQLITSGGLGTMGFGFYRNRSKNCKSKETGRVYHGRWRISDEYSGDGNGGNTGYRNYDLSAEQ